MKRQAQSLIEYFIILIIIMLLSSIILIFFKALFVRTSSENDIHVPASKESRQSEENCSSVGGEWDYKNGICEPK
ncbi:MAG: hypothetical protein PHX18_08535 [Candidatus Gastranaerophilales bacterium]|nr:hypothetical protein [Candidatus Gastranaerophilales bacterium]